MNDTVNCTISGALAGFPGSPIPIADLRQGWVVIYALIAIYLFLALAIICDDYFVPALEELCRRFDIQEDVAGATFMAASSSAPEFATTVIAVFVTDTDVGLATVVGSAVFNLLFVIAACGLVCQGAVQLDWWPILRDCGWYIISVGALVLFIYDERITWWESVILMVMYVLYITFMFFNKRVERSVKDRTRTITLPRFLQPCCLPKRSKDKDQRSPLLSSGSSACCGCLPGTSDSGSSTYDLDAETLLPLAEVADTDQTAMEIELDCEARTDSNANVPNSTKRSTYESTTDEERSVTSSPKNAERGEEENSESRFWKVVNVKRP